MTSELVERHLGYAHAIVADLAGKYPPNITRDDLTGAAELGLVQAANSYDPERGIAFTTFAYCRIRGAVLDEVRKAWQASHLSSSPQQQGRESAGELSELPACDSSYAESAEQSDEHVFTRASSSADLESVPDTRESAAGRVLRQEEAKFIRSAMEALPQRLRFVLQAYYYDDLSLVSIGQQLKLSKSWVSRLHAQALAMVAGTMSQSHDLRNRRSRKAPRMPSASCLHGKLSPAAADNI